MTDLPEVNQSQVLQDFFPGLCSYSAFSSLVQFWLHSKISRQLKAAQIAYLDFCSQSRSALFSPRLTASVNKSPSSGHRTRRKSASHWQPICTCGNRLAVCLSSCHPPFLPTSLARSYEATANHRKLCERPTSIERKFSERGFSQ